MTETQGYIQATEFGLLWLIPFFPFLGALVNGLTGARLQKNYGPHVNHWIAIIMPSLSFVVALMALASLIGLDSAGHRALTQTLFPFINVGTFDADMAFWFDPLSATLTLIITFIGTLIHVYATGYMKGDPGYWRFFTYLNLFMGMMLLLALGDNFMVMFIGWEGVGLCSYLLISFWYTDINNATAGMKAFVVNRVGDFAFVLGLAFLFWGLSGNFEERGYVSTISDSHESAVATAHQAGAHVEQKDHAEHGAKEHAANEAHHVEAHHKTGAHAEDQHAVYDHAHDEHHADAAAEAHAGGHAAHHQDHGEHDAHDEHHAEAGHHGDAHHGPTWEHAAYSAGATPAASLKFNVLRKIIAQQESLWAENSPTAKTVWGIPLIILVGVLLFIAATGKSAQIPLYVWLPDAMAGPTPVSGLIHAATMVTAGVYMIARLGFLISLSPTAMTVIAVVGALTAFFAATIGLFQYDIKKVLAYSTVSQLGYMFIGVGIGAYWAGVYHLLTHALFKACLFLGSGSVILGCHHEQDMRWMGGLKKYMPQTHLSYLMACMMITTAPVFFISNGFFSKDEILWKAFDAGHLLIPGWTLWAVGAMGAVCTSFYMWRSYYMTFTGSYRGPNPHAHHHDDHDDHGHHGGEPHESPMSMTAVLTILWVLAVVSICLGFWPLLATALGPDSSFYGLLHEPIFEKWVFPAVAETTLPLADGSARLMWLSKQGHHPELAGLSLHTWEFILAGASIALTLGGWFAARVLYKDAKSQVPAKLLENQSLQPTYRLILNKYWIDEVYDWCIVRPTRLLSTLFFDFDRRVIDGAVNAAGYVGRLIGILDGFIDSLVVDGAVNGVAQLVRQAGHTLRQTQTGRIQTYLVGAVGGVLILVFFNFMIYFVL